MYACTCMGIGKGHVEQSSKRCHTRGCLWMHLLPRTKLPAVEQRPARKAAKKWDPNVAQYTSCNAAARITHAR